MATKDAIIRRKNASGTWDTIYPKTTTSNITDWNTAISAITITALNDIGDVNAPSPSNGQALVWDTDKWVPGDAGGGGDVQTVNGVSPDGNGEVTLSASDVGAAATSHTHAISAITNLQTTLDGKQASLGTGSNNQFLRWGALGEPYWDTVTAADVGAYASTNPSGFQTAAQVAASISALVDSSPATLDTLNELAAALGDDPNFATTVSNSIGTKVSKSGDTMTGNLLIATGATESGIRFRGSTLDFVGRYSNYVSLYNQLNGGQELKIPDSGNATLGGNAIFTDAYHPNADKWTTARTLTINGDGSGAVSWDGSANATISLTNQRMSELGTITYGAGWLQWSDQSGNGGAGTNGAAPANPTNEWWHHLIMNHANSAGYYFDIAAAFHSDQMYFRRNVAGTLQTWRELIHSGNIGSQSVSNSDKVDGYHIVVGSTGTDTNTLYFTT